MAEVTKYEQTFFYSTIISKNKFINFFLKSKFKKYVYFDEKRKKHHRLHKEQISLAGFLHHYALWLPMILSTWARIKYKITEQA